jgi:hypothetical protein
MYKIDYTSKAVVLLQFLYFIYAYLGISKLVMLIEDHT